MPENTDPRQARLTAAEEERQARQAEAADDGLDANSTAGRQAAVRRGDPVQLTGEEREAGRQEGTATTTNESTAPAASGHNFVTGAAGFPLPASGGQEPQRPGEYNPDMAKARREAGGEDVAVSAQEQGARDMQAAQAEGSGPPAKSANKDEWVEYARSQGDTEAGDKTKDQLIEDHG